MGHTYIKQSSTDSAATDPAVSEKVRLMLEALRERREPEAIELARSFDSWEGPILVDPATVRAARSTLAPTLVDDIVEAHQHIRDFAAAQRESLQPFEIEVSPGLRAGHRLVPVNVSGCYVPAGRFAHIASALMSVTASKVAGFDTVGVHDRSRRNSRPPPSGHRPGRPGRTRS